MVKVIDFDDEGCEDAGLHRGQELAPSWDDDRANPNASLRMALALSCYPIVSQVAKYVDLTTLHDLSRTCRQIRANLLEYRTSLITQSLRCMNSDANPGVLLGDALSASLRQWTASGKNGDRSGRILSGRVGACVTDMVDECRQCGTIACRNCTAKQPSLAVLRSRHRRLCRTCMKSPLDRLTTISRLSGDGEEAHFIDYARAPCDCDRSVWICQPCGQTLRVDDTIYLRGWTWRSRYSACGGIGAGLGQGNEGVECGRHSDCLDARKVEKEIECDADELAALEAEIAEHDGRQWAGSSYTTHEIVGIGGKVKKKIKKKMLVGAIVKEYEDERETGQFLKREQDGANRSWCSWCMRVVVGKKDMEQPGKSSVSVASTSSSASIQ